MGYNMQKKWNLKFAFIIFMILILFSGCISSDSDGDKLSDASENEGNQIIIYNIDGTMKKQIVTSDPNKIDTDNDGLNDYEEMMKSSNPSKADTDGDGLEDADEESYGTSIIHFDTWEITINGEIKRVKADFPKNAILPTEYDSDKDGLFDSEEYYLGIDPSNSDTDADGSTDYFDPEPLSNLKIDITLISFLLNKQKDLGNEADIYFVLQIGEEIITTNVWKTKIGQEIELNSYYNIDFKDSNAYNTNSITIRIDAYDEDPGDTSYDDIIRINESSSIKTLTFDINETDIKQMSTTGDDGTLNFSIQIQRE
jgi:hypothetical protein